MSYLGSHPSKAIIKDAVLRLRAGDVVGLPTETVYGLAGSILSEDGLRKIFSSKARPFFDPLIVHVSSIDQAQELVSEWPPLADFLARRFWPGPLTLILPKNERVHPLITSGLTSVGLRQPRHEVALELIRELGCPVAAPSANKFGKTSPSEAAHVSVEFSDILVLDGGPCEIGLESTVVEVLSDRLRILRPGGITQDDLQMAVFDFSKIGGSSSADSGTGSNSGIDSNSNSNSFSLDITSGAKASGGAKILVERAESQVSPGHLKHHYMPPIPLVILSHKNAPTAIELAQIARELGAHVSKPAKLSLENAPEQVARSLYHDLRIVAESGADLIFVYRDPKQNSGYWDAIWDRLSRAATLAL